MHFTQSTSTRRLGTMLGHFSRIATKTQNPRKFSTAKISRYTVYCFLVPTRYSTITCLPVTRKKKMTTPIPTMMKAGTMKDHPHGGLDDSVSAQKEGIIVPKMLPTAGLEPHIPISKPRLSIG